MNRMIAVLLPIFSSAIAIADQQPAASEPAATVSQRAAPASQPAASKPSALALKLGDSLTLVPHGQYRPRAMFHGARDLSSGTNFEAISQRVRFGVEARLQRFMSMLVEVQDVRIWGEELNTLDSSAGGFDLHQGWVALQCKRLGVTVRVGRQEITIDNQRLIGAVGWSDQGRTFDAALIDHRLADLLAVRAFYAKLSERDALVSRTNAAGEQVVLSGALKDADLAALSVRLQRFPWMRPSLTAVYDHVGVTEQHRITFGTFIDSAPLAGFSYQLEAYLQLGRREAAPGAAQDLMAFLGAVRLSYAAPAYLLSPSVDFWFDFLSGDSDPTDDTSRSFDTLFATNHKFYGFMDFFLNIPLHTGGRGLIDLGGRLGIVPLKGLATFVDFHHFRLATEDGGGATSLGSELDLLVDYAVNRYLSFQAVLAVFLPDDAITGLRGGDAAEPYGYLQTNLQF